MVLDEMKRKKITLRKNAYVTMRYIRFSKPSSRNSSLLGLFKTGEYILGDVIKITQFKIR